MSTAHPPQLSMIAKRRIEAEMLKHVYDVLKREVGLEQAQKVIGEAVRQSSIQQAQQFAASEGRPTSLTTFIELNRLWEAEDALKIDVQKKTETEYHFNVVRCRYAEMYKEMGLQEIGHLLSCQRDGTFCEGYDPQLKFQRSQTIMQGASHCDFQYHYVAAPSSSKNNV